MLSDFLFYAGILEDTVGGISRSKVARDYGISPHAFLIIDNCPKLMRALAVSDKSVAACFQEPDHRLVKTVHAA